MNRVRFSSHALVFLQFVGALASFFPFQQRGGQQPYFLALSALGLILGLITLTFNRVGNFRIYPEPRSNMRLITAGPYSLIRHPMYTSLLLLLSGSALYWNHPLNYAGAVLVAIAVFLKAKREERFLADLYPEYREYIRKTSGFIPFLF